MLFFLFFFKNSILKSKSLVVKFNDLDLINHAPCLAQSQVGDPNPNYTYLVSSVLTILRKRHQNHVDHVKNVYHNMTREESIMPLQFFVLCGW